MILSEKQKTVIQDLQAQEQLCIQKYGEYEKQARDPELKRLFGILKDDEQTHYDSLSQLMNGQCPVVGGKVTMAKDYNPMPTYTGNFNEEDKEYDKYLCTDCITTEKYVSTAYNDDLFQFGDENVRDLFNHIQTEEQNHAEMIYKYKTANQMAS